MAEKTLFDDVFEKTGFAYLSDLRLDGRSQMLADAVKTVDAKQYSADDWRQLASYVMGQSLPIDWSGAVREHLLEYLEMTPISRYLWHKKKEADE